MLTQEGCRSRLARLWDAVPDTMEWLLIADPRHVHYFSNFLVHPLSFSAGQRAFLLLERNHGATLLADNFTRRSATGGPHVDCEVIKEWYDHRHSVINRDHTLLAALRTVSESLFGRVGAVEAEWLPVGAWEILGLDHESHSVSREALPSGRFGGDAAVDLGTTIRRLRRQKESDELAIIEACVHATEAGQARAREVIRAGASEFDVYRAVQTAALEAAGQPGLIYGDFRAVNAAQPKAGGLPTNATLSDGDLFILDYSIVLCGYRSDFTNTFSVSEPTDEQQMLFELCQTAMQAGADSLRAGVAAKDVYAATSGPLEGAGYGPLPHHAGHGIGLAHPEPPILVPESEDVLLPGDVVTLEPGLYVEGIGGMRIENNYRITETGAVQLSNHVIAL